MKIGCILYFKYKGGGGVCGQTVGADGAGSYAYVFYGDPIEAEMKAREFLAKIKNVEYADIVSGEEGYYGSFIKEVQECWIGKGAMKNCRKF